MWCQSSQIQGVENFPRKYFITTLVGFYQPIPNMKRLTLLLLVTALVLSCEKPKPNLENTPPIIKSIIADPDSVFPGDTVKLSFDYFDAEGDSIDIQWTSLVGTFAPDPFNRIERWIAPKIPGDYVIQLRIFDETDDKGDIDSIKIVVIDRPGTFTDLRDGHSYKWVKIGQQIWMAENLAYLPYVTSLLGNPSGYYINDYYTASTTEPKQTSNYKKYGVLYGHESAQRACPPGWHLSTDEEWKTLEIFLGMDPAIAELYDRYGYSMNVAKSLMSDILWSGNNSSGFNAVPGGTIVYYTRPGYEHWVYTGADETAVYLSPAYGSSLCRAMGYWGVDRVSIDELEGFSVRCVKDK